MTKRLSLSVIAAALFAATAAQAAPPPPKIVVLDRGALIQFSKAGRDIAHQLQALGTQSRASIEAQQKALSAEGQQLRQQVAILGGDARKQKEDAFQAKVRNAQESAERRQLQIQQAAAAAQQSIVGALTPIIDEIVKARGANLVVDKSAVIYANNNAFDITPEAITRLDAKLPTVKVTLGATPAKP